jgi:hypothetical protein
MDPGGVDTVDCSGPITDDDISGAGFDQAPDARFDARFNDTSDEKSDDAFDEAPGA